MNLILTIFKSLINGTLPVENIPTLSGRLYVFDNAIENIGLIGSNRGLEFNQAFDSSITMILYLSGFLGFTITISIIGIIFFKNLKYFESPKFNDYYPKSFCFHLYYVSQSLQILSIIPLC